MGWECGQKPVIGGIHPCGEQGRRFNRLHGESSVVEEVLPADRPLGVRQEEILELAKAPTALHPHIAVCDFIPECGQHSIFVGPAIYRGHQFKVRVNFMQQLPSNRAPPGASGAPTGRVRSILSWPWHQLFLHLELGVAVVLADLLDVEEFMEAVGFNDHDKDPAFRIHGLQPGDELPNFHGAPSWRLSCGVGVLRCVLIAIAYRVLQDRDRGSVAKTGSSMRRGWACSVHAASPNIWLTTRFCVDALRHLRLCLRSPAALKA
jgi:hypothetical protein